MSNEYLNDGQLTRR